MFDQRSDNDERSRTENLCGVQFGCRHSLSVAHCQSLTVSHSLSVTHCQSLPAAQSHNGIVGSLARWIVGVAWRERTMHQLWHRRTFSDTHTHTSSNTNPSLHQFMHACIHSLIHGLFIHSFIIGQTRLPVSDCDANNFTLRTVSWFDGGLLFGNKVPG